MEGEAADEATDPATEMKAADAGATSVMTAMAEEARSRMAEAAGEEQRSRVEAEATLTSEKDRGAEWGEAGERQAIWTGGKGKGLFRSAEKRRKGKRKGRACDCSCCPRQQVKMACEGLGSSKWLGQEWQLQQGQKEPRGSGKLC